MAPRKTTTQKAPLPSENGDDLNLNSEVTSPSAPSSTSAPDIDNEVPPTNEASTSTEVFGRLVRVTF